MKVKAFITHKVAERYSDCQDRFAVDGNALAVSDGMGETWMQKIWAELLVETYVKDDGGWTPDHESIKPLCRDWQTKVKLYIQRQKDSGVKENVIYRNERRLIEGESAGATFAGIRFKGKQWKGVVLGDSCLIEWNGKEAVFHTSQDVEVFDNHPDYFDSSINKRGKGEPIEVSGVVDGDNQQLLLVSDPLSDFLMRRHKDGDMAEYLRNILAVGNHDEFEELVKDWRGEGMHNDDTTLVVVEYDGDETLSIVHQDNLQQLIETEDVPSQDTNATECGVPENKQDETVQE